MQLLSSRVFGVGLIIALLCGLLVFGQRTPPSAAQGLYLLAGTPDPESEAGYPATLYMAHAGKLKLVREVVPQTEGVSVIEMWRDAIFLIHPVLSPQAVAIVHTDAPERADDLVIKRSEGLFYPVSPLIAQSEPKQGVIDALLPFDVGQVDPAAVTLFDVMVQADSSGQRIQLNTWQKYKTIRKEGDPGGAVQSFDFVAAVVGDKLVVPPNFGHAVAIDSQPLPPFLLQAVGRSPTKTLLIVAASQRYLVAKMQFSAPPDLAADVFVNDQQKSSWKTIQLEGDRSRSRLFGTWLATAVIESDPTHSKVSPGIENERNSAPGSVITRNGFTAERPNTRNLYAGSGIWRPGVLVLQKIDDDRKIRIETGQEDSEILNVDGDVVLYRVNDTIYQARIDGNQLQGTSVVVRDEDVPEIHWVFRGPQ